MLVLGLEATRWVFCELVMARHGVLSMSDAMLAVAFCWTSDGGAVIVAVGMCGVVVCKSG